MGNFQPITRERAEEIRQALRHSRSSGEGLAFDRDTNQLVGTTSVKKAPDDRVNAIGRFDTHYLN